MIHEPFDPPDREPRKRTAQSGIDAALTIAARTPGLVAPGLDLSGKNAREARLMVQEKSPAAYEGAWAAQAAWGAFLLKAVFGGVISADHVSHGWVESLTRRWRRRERPSAPTRVALPGRDG